MNGPAKKALEHYRRLLLTKGKKDDFVSTLLDHVRHKDFTMIKDLIALMAEHGKTKMLLIHFEEEETVLHMIVKMRAPAEVVSATVENCPALMLEDRGGSDLYRGQTALHIAVTNGNTEAVDVILQKSKNLGANQKSALLHHQATGSRFESTVMLGELPLTVASLTFNTGMMDVLIAHDAELDRQNSRGDNVCHSLIRYSHLYPEKLQDIMKLFEYLVTLTVGTVDSHSASGLEMGLPFRKGAERTFVHIWVMENENGLNPLQLAAKLGQQVIFKFIMELKGIYCFVNSEDGLFDVNFYDVTDLEATPALTSAQVGPAPDILDNHDVNPKLTRRVKPKSSALLNRKPTLEMIFNSDPVTIFKLIHFSPLNYVVNRKWRYYRWFYLFWGLFHMAFMIGYTIYTIQRSRLKSSSTNNSEPAEYAYKIGKDIFVTVYTALSLAVALVYFLQEIVRIIKGRMPWTLFHVVNCYHNGPFRLMLVLYSVAVVIDFVWRMLDPYYENYLLVASMILGWWFLVFFLRGFRQFSFFTVMIQKVLVGDMFRFSIIIGMELIAFTTAMYVAFQGTTSTHEDVKGYGRLLQFLFKAMFGFTSIDELFDTRQPWFTVSLYISFVLLTYVLMVNSLIAMMSNTCSIVSKDRDVQWRVQQLSVVLFFESIFPSSCLRLVGEPRFSIWYDSKTKHYIRKKRFYMEVRSLHDVSRSKSRLRMTSESMLESIFHSLKDAHFPGFGIAHMEVATREKPEEKPVVLRETREDAPVKPKDENKKEKKKKKKKKQEEPDEHTPNTEETVATVTRESPAIPLATVATFTGPLTNENSEDNHVTADIPGHVVPISRRSTLEIHHFPMSVCDHCSGSNSASNA